MADSPWQAMPKDLDVRWSADLEPMGCYDPLTHTIWLRTGLNQAERRSTLAHELVHALKGDECVRLATTEWHEDKQEEHVRHLAARMLIALNELTEALAWSQDEQELADELWVDVATVRTRLERLTPLERDYIESRLWAEERGA